MITKNDLKDYVQAISELQHEAAALVSGARLSKATSAIIRANMREKQKILKELIELINQDSL